MPTAPLLACPCGSRRASGEPCPRCGKGKRQQHHTRSTTERGYGSDWQRFREYILSQTPLCIDCEAEDMVSAATELHHRIKIKDRPDLRLDPENVMPLCDRHHDLRTRRGE